MCGMQEREQSHNFPVLIFAVVNGNEHGDVIKCPENYGLVQQRGGGTKCVECKKENKAAKTACGHPKNEVKQCQGWKKSGYCDDNHEYAYIVQRSCLYICEICTQ